jgi:hypothetical protein
VHDHVYKILPLILSDSVNNASISYTLVLKGLSPGAALVFLLAGPATNAATLTVVARYFGKQATMVYLASIAICSLVFGWLTNRLYEWLELDIIMWANEPTDVSDSLFMQVSAVVVLFFILLNPLSQKLKDTSDG